MDYKFILILAICLILYYIYNEVEKVKHKVEEVSESVNNLKKEISLKKTSNNIKPILKKPTQVFNTQPMINKFPVSNVPPARINNVSNQINSIKEKSQQKLEIKKSEMILIEDDLTTIDSNTNKKNLNENLSDTETPESYENNSHDLALYSNDNNETSLAVEDVIEKTDEIILENESEKSDENKDQKLEESDINIIETNDSNNTSDIMLLDDSNENTSSSSDNSVKKKNQKLLTKTIETPINLEDRDISNSLNKILNDKKEINYSESENLETTDDNNDEELEVNIDLDEIVNESSNNKLKMKTLKRKKLAELQKIAAEYNISLNKIKDGKLKNKTKNELCKEIVSKQY